MNALLNAVAERGPEMRRIALSVLIVGIPVLFLRFTHDPFNVPKLFILGVGIGFVLAVRAIELAVVREWHRLKAISLPAALMAVPLTLSWALSPYRSWSVLGSAGRFQGLIPYLLAILLGVLVADAFRGRMGRLAFLLCWAGGVVGAYALLQTLGLDPFEWNLFGAPTEAISTTGNPNFTGGFLGIALPIALAVVASDPGRRRVAIRLLILIAIGWIVARSQGGWAAGIAGSSIVGGYLLSERFKWAPIGGFVIAALVALATVGAVLISVVMPDGRLSTETGRVRARWWSAATDMGMSRPLAGTGPNTFAVEGIEHRPLEDAIAFNFDFPNDPHSVPLSLFANLGLFGLIGFIGVIAWAMYLFWTFEEPSLITVALLGGVVAYVVQSLVSIDEIVLRTAFWICIGGLGAAAVASEQPVPSRGKNKKVSPQRHQVRSSAGSVGPISVGLAAILFLGSLYGAGTVLLADIKVRDGSNAFARGDTDKGRAAFADALALRDSPDYEGILALDLARAAEGEDGRYDPDLVEAAAEAFGYTDELPYVFGLVSHARLLAGALGKGSEEAVALYEQAMDRDPLNPLIRTEFALELGKLERAQEAIDVLMPLKDDLVGRYEAYWGALALSAVRVGDETLAQEAIGIALGLASGEPNANRAQRILEGSSF